MQLPFHFSFLSPYYNFKTRITLINKNIQLIFCILFLILKKVLFRQFCKIRQFCRLKHLTQRQGNTENIEKNNKEISMFVYPPPPPKLKGTTNLINNTNKKNYFFRNKTIVNPFVSFVLFVLNLAFCFSPLAFGL
jgi:hypothetical protein